MVLVDTSVLIDYLKDVDNKSTEKFNEILKKGLPFGINNYIYQELLQAGLRLATNPGPEPQRKGRKLGEWLTSGQS